MAERRSLVRRAVRFAFKAAWTGVVAGADLGDPKPPPEPEPTRPARSIRRGEDPRYR